MKIINAYKYLLYRIFDWQLANFGENQNPKFVAIIGCSLFICFNILTLMVWLQFLTGYKIYIQELFSIIALSLLVLLNVYIFIIRNEFEAIILKFSKEVQTQRKKNTIWCFAYVLSTHTIFFLSVFILSPNKQ